MPDCLNDSTETADIGNDDEAIELTLLSNKNKSAPDMYNKSNTTELFHEQDKNETSNLNNQIHETRGLLLPSAHDGVFTNLSAKPEIMILPATSDSPPPYEALQVPFSNNTNNQTFESSEYFDEVIIDDLEVGGYPVFILYLIGIHSPDLPFLARINFLHLVSIFFEWIGFILALSLSQSHAAKFGAWSGFGITVALQSIRLEEWTVNSPWWKEHPDALSLVGFSLAFVGYVVFLCGLFYYNRLRKDAMIIARELPSSNRHV